MAAIGRYFKRWNRRFYRQQAAIAAARANLTRQVPRSGTIGAYGGTLPRASLPLSALNRRSNNSLPTQPFRMSVADAPVSRGLVVRGQRMAPLHVTHSKIVLPNLIGSSSFVTNTYNVNPGLSSNFPWVAQVAALFEKYRVLNMNFRYVPSSATSSIGNVMLAFDYDAYDSTPSNKANLMMYADSCTMPTWLTCDLRLRPNDLKDRGSLYVRSASFSGDKKTYDLGKFIVATQGQADTSVVGDVYIDYTIEFLIPSPSLQPPGSMIDSNNGGSGLVATAPWGTVALYDYFSEPAFDHQIVSNTDYFQCLRTGNYLISVQISGTGVSIIGGNFTLPYSANYPDDAIGTYTIIANSAATNVQAIMAVNITDGSAIKIVCTATTVTRAIFIAVAVDSYFTTTY